MKWIGLVIGVIFVLGTNVSAQTNLFLEGFEVYTAGQRLAHQAGAPWTTWYGEANTEADGFIVTEAVYSGQNSLKIVVGNDQVLHLGDKQTGRYQVKFYINVKENHNAFLNLLQNFNADNSSWGVEMEFYYTGDGVVFVDNKFHYFKFSIDTWTLINVIIDLDEDLATIFVENEEVLSWQWSVGAYGSSNLLKLDALNLYGKTKNNIASQYYIDDIEVNQLVAANPPLNLTSSVSDNDISLSWEVPAGGSPVSYTLYRNGNEYKTGITDLFYNDIDLYPREYTYQVRANYGEYGYSVLSNETLQIISGGTTRNLALFEIGSGTWCTYCPGSAMAADELVANNKSVAIVEYHVNDKYQNAFSNARNTYYDISTIPTLLVDGVLTYEGGDKINSLYNEYLPLYESRMAVPSVHAIDLTVERSASGEYQATVSIDEVYSYFPDDLYLYVLLTESHIPEDWLGFTEVNFVYRYTYPDANGVALDFTSNTNHTEQINFTIPDSINQNNCELVAFVQHKSSKEITQAVKYDIGALVSVDQLEKQKIKVYPNPAKSKLYIEAIQNGKLQIYNNAGQRMYIADIQYGKNEINIRSLSPGIYYINILSETEMMHSKLIIVE